jgi:broad specificity phosphatase PhoE
VESDRELAIRLQTEEVLQHSLSNEWSAHSLGGGGVTNGSSRGSAVYASAQASYSSDDADGGGRDLDDGTLRQMMGYGGGGVKHVSSSGSVGSGSWNSNGSGTSGGRESWQSYKGVDGGNLFATPPQHSTIARVVGASHYSDVSPPSPSNGGGDLRNVLLENAVRTDVGFFGAPPTAKPDHGASAASAPPVEHTARSHVTADTARSHVTADTARSHVTVDTARSHVTADVASVKGHATVDSGRVGSQGSGPVLLSGPRDVLAGAGDVGRVAGMADGGSSGGGGKRRMWVMRHGMRIDEHDVTWREKSNRPYDPYLTSEGRRQARAAASMILAESERDGAVVHVVSSPFLRCLQTAAEVANSLGIERITIDYGLCEALLPRNVATSPTYLPPDRLRMTDGSFARISFTHTSQPEPVWPEDLATARARYTDAFIRIPEALGPAGNIVLIAHGDTVAQFVAIAKGIPEDSVYSVPNCAIASADVLSSSGGKYGRLRAGDDILTLDGLVE